MTTYLDNDDVLNVRFAADLQQRAATADEGSFFFYTQGYQFFTDYKYLMRIRYNRNHFASVVENAFPMKTIYGYGSHYYIDKIPGSKIEYVKNLSMWCEVIHEKNMVNEAHFITANRVNKNVLVDDFGLQEKAYYGIGIYLFRFLPKFFKTLIRRGGCFIFRNRFK